MKIYKDKSAAKFLVKPDSKRSTRTISNINLLSLDTILDLGNLSQSVESAFLCVSHNGHQLFGIGYHFNIFRSQLATRKKVNFTPCHLFVLDETAGVIIFVLFSYWCRITINNMNIVYLFNDTLHVHVHVLECEDIRTFSMSLLDCGIVFL